jgi:hypothetical protein
LTAILKAATITPDRDRACQYLAEYLRDALNNEFEAIAHDMPLELGDRAILGIREYNTINFLTTELPGLAVYRAGSRSEAFAQSSAVAAYYLPSMAAQEAMPGIMRWVEVRINRALWRLHMVWDDAYPVVTDMDQARSEWAIGLDRTGAEIPYLRVFFEFTEIGA